MDLLRNFTYTQQSDLTSIMTFPDVVDIEVILKDWAWTAFQKANSKESQKLKYNDVKLEVKWNRIDISCLEPEYINKDRNVHEDSQVVFNSTYENCTSAPQDNSFTTERSTTSTCTIFVEKGFTKGINVELKLAVPNDLMEVTTGFGKEVHMNKGTEQTQEKHLTWTANSSIRVREGYRVTASLEVQEESFTADFNMKVRISGRALVVLTNMRDNNSFLYSVEGDITQILYDKLGREEYFIREGRALVWTVKGKCQFCYGIKQHIRLTEEEM